MCVVSMGCVNSKKDGTLRPNLFQVVNVDDYGNPVNPGQLEVTENELVFYQQSRPPVRWPLCTLRRYGCDADHFSFESGRRSPTGPGIYAFLCRRADQIVSLLEIRLQPVQRPRLCDTDMDHHPRIAHRLSSITSLGPLSPQNPTAPRSVSYSNGELPPATTTTLSQDETNNNTNKNKTQPSPPESPVEHIYTNTILGTEPLFLAASEANTSPGHIYVNIVPGTDNLVPVPPALEPARIPTAIDWEQDADSVHCYANLELEGSVPPLNYIVLDLNQQQTAVPSTPPPDSPKKPSLPGYATIDFDKTAALSHSVNPSFDNDSVGCRKTRHNSAFCDPLANNPPPRHSTASD